MSKVSKKPQIGGRKKIKKVLRLDKYRQTLKKEPIKRPGLDEGLILC